jgi:hypothetical protein
MNASFFAMLQIPRPAVNVQRFSLRWAAWRSVNGMPAAGRTRNRGRKAVKVSVAMVSSRIFHAANAPSPDAVITHPGGLITPSTGRAAGAQILRSELVHPQVVRGSIGGLDRLCYEIGAS